MRLFLQQPQPGPLFSAGEAARLPWTLIVWKGELHAFCGCVDLQFHK